MAANFLNGANSADRRKMSDSVLELTQLLFAFREIDIPQWQ